ncbi:MAG: hypothetical protein VB078_05270 [Clostridiaceae bacterium]|nr:hypothetical protein [Clostridiaceae bacterium]
MLLTFCLALSLLGGAANAAELLIASPSKTSFVMNGTPILVPQAYNVKDNNYLQLRAIALLLNGTESQFNVSWDGTYAAIETGKPYTDSTNPTSLETTNNVIPSRTAFMIDGKVVAFEKAYLIDGDTNYLQLREVAQKLSGTKSQFNVYWDNNLEQAVIETSVAYTGVKSSAQETTSILTMDKWNYTIEVKGKWTVGADASADAAVNFFSDAKGLISVVCVGDVGSNSNRNEFVNSVLAGLEDSGDMVRVKQLSKRVISDSEAYQYLYEYRREGGSVVDIVLSVIFKDNALIVISEAYSTTERWNTDEQIDYVANSIVAITKKQGTTPTPAPSTLGSAAELKNYLQSNYSSVQTSLGVVPLKYTVLFNNMSFMPEDYTIWVEYDSLKVFNYLYDKNITQAKIDTFKQEMKSYMLTLATDIISKMPGKKLNGEYHYSYYKYPNLKLDLVSYTDNEWTNFGVIDLRKSSYSNYTASDKLTWIYDYSNSFFRNYSIE